MAQDLITTLHQKTRNDQAFNVSIAGDVGASNTINLHIKNPADSGKELWFVDVDAIGVGPQLATVYDKFSSAPSGGSSVEVQATRMTSDGADNDGVATANKNVSFTDTERQEVGVSGGGSGASSVGGTSDIPTMVIEPNREAVIEIKNIGSSTKKYAIKTIYFQANT